MSIDLVSQQLEKCEKVIERGLKSFIEVGNALMEIRDKRLYRADYGTFEDYCRERWGMERAHSYRLIDAANVVKNLSPIGDKLPQTESQARPLSRLEPEQQAEAWQRAVETAPNGKITAKHVEEIAQDIRRIQSRASTNEWITPTLYVNAARQVLHTIDIDPASNFTANEIIKAQKIYTISDNGLLYDWPGKVWLNPPYGGVAKDFVIKLIQQFEAGLTTEAIVLVNANSTETQWFTPLWNYLLCFTNHRINFHSNESKSSGSTHGSVFVYLGDNIESFVQNFKQFGPIVKRIDYEY